MNTFDSHGSRSHHPYAPENYFPEPSYPQQSVEQSEPSSQYASKFVSYGSSAAIQCEQSATRGGFHTLSFDIAHAKGQKDFEWKSKLSIQLTQNELPVFVAFCLGWLNEIRFDLHGGDAKKWIEFIRQDKHCFSKSGSAQHKLAATPIPYTELALFGSLAMSQYLRNFPFLDGSAAIQAIGAMAQSGASSIKKPMAARRP